MTDATTAGRVCSLCGTQPAETTHLCTGLRQPVTAALPPFDGAAWCGWMDPHPPHLYAAYGGVDDDVQVYSCSGEGAD